MRTISISEIKLVPEVYLTLLIARLSVSLFSPKYWMPGESIDSEVEKRQNHLLITTVINGVAKRTPWESTCLVKALACHAILKRRKISHCFFLGAGYNVATNLKAHAWISVNDVVVVGEFDHSEIKPIMKKCY